MGGAQKGGGKIDQIIVTNKRGFEPFGKHRLDHFGCLEEGQLSPTSQLRLSI